MKTIVVPDIHGRTFWKDLKTKYKDFDGNIIFLGDYVDPYSNEKIYWKDTIENLKEIIDFARNNSNVILLIGNHDYHYIWDYGKCSRFSNKHFKELHKIYTDNIDLFKITHYDEQNNILYSHAGVLKGWLEDVNIKLEDINNLIKNKPSKLWKVSYRRGGYDNNGSVLWADINEHHLDTDNLDEYLIQIFGHTQLDDPLIEVKRNRFCIDSKQLFIVEDRNINILK